MVSRALGVVDDSDEYTRELAGHLRHAAGPNAAVRLSGGTGGYAIVDAGGAIAVQPIYSQNGTLDANQVVKAVELGRRQGGHKVLLVTNARSLTPLAQREVAAAGDPVQLIQWHPGLGSGPIAGAVDQLRRSAAG